MDYAPLLVAGGVACCMLMAMTYTQRAMAVEYSFSPAVQARLRPQLATLDALLEGKHMGAREAVAAVERAFPGWTVRFGRSVRAGENPYATPTVLLNANEAGRVVDWWLGSDGQPCEKFL